MHNLGWRLLMISTQKPKQLAKSAADIQKVKEALKSNQVGAIASVAILILAWWFPYMALLLNLTFWSYWIFVSAKVRKKN